MWEPMFEEQHWPMPLDSNDYTSPYNWQYDQAAIDAMAEVIKNT